MKWEPCSLCEGMDVYKYNEAMIYIKGLEKHDFEKLLFVYLWAMSLSAHLKIL